MSLEHLCSIDTSSIIPRVHPTSIEICAGAGGQALGLEMAGFQHTALVELDADACATLRLNRPEWNVLRVDVKTWDASRYRGADLLAGGVPCPPFSKAGHQLGREDERDLFPDMLRLAEQVQPQAVMIENVRGLLDPAFDEYRASVDERLARLGFVSGWKLLNASDYGVPQLRPRVICVALKPAAACHFEWPQGVAGGAPTVGQALRAEMGRHGWKGADSWAQQANQIAPTLVGGSKKHGGPDLGPTRARKAWLGLGVDGKTIADDPPAVDFDGVPKLTVGMAALLQGFPPTWRLVGKKTSAYRQVGNAFPPPVAHAVGKAIREALELSAPRQLPLVSASAAG